jgi:hypothetical protein
LEIRILFAVRVIEGLVLRPRHLRIFLTHAYRIKLEFSLSFFRHSRAFAVIGKRSAEQFCQVEMNQRGASRLVIAVPVTSSLAGVTRDRITVM